MAIEIDPLKRVLFLSFLESLGRSLAVKIPDFVMLGNACPGKQTIGKKSIAKTDRRG